jgi:hypothetical protein
MGIIYTALSALLVLALVPALHPAQPPVPPVAAFAPVAQQNITKPPPDQASTAGKGANQNGNGEAAGGSGATPTPSPTPPAPPGAGGESSAGNQQTTPRTLDCIDGPGGPRQIEDTQSPPCIPYWKGDNGGATYQGVDANTITVAVSGDFGGQHGFPYWSKFFNDRFQLYGRQIKWVGFGCPGDSDSPQADLVSEADTVITKYHPFAVLGCSDFGGREKYFYDELARHGVISVAATPDLRTEADFSSFAPYEWDYYPGYDIDETNLAAQACLLKDQAAPAYAATPLNNKRRFGIVYTAYSDSASIDLSYLINGLGACGIGVAKQDIKGVDYVAHGASQQRSASSAQEAEAAVTQFASDQITPVIVIAHSSDTIQVLEQADSASYHPEWMMGFSFWNTSWSPTGPLPPSDQWDHAFGLDYQNKLVPVQDNPWYQAVMQEDPTYSWPYAPLSYNGWYAYEGMLLFASGLQMAGPHLTPQTFQQGLWNTHFPNPPSPYFEGTVGFNHDHTWIKDRPLVWYSAESTGPWGQSGVWCYVNLGRRYTDATLPSGYPYDSGTCES